MQERIKSNGNIFGRGTFNGVPGVIDSDVIFDNKTQIYRPKKELSNVINNVTRLPIERIKVIKRKVSPHRRIRGFHRNQALAV